MSKDKTAKVQQRDKLKNTFEIKDLNWTDKQKEFINLALNKEVKIIFISGPAGSSKSLISVYASLKLLQAKKISDIIYIRSAVESSDAKIGYLPGGPEEKLHFFNLPFYDKLEELLNKNDIEMLNKEQRVSFFPINFARGMSWNVKSIIIDECQNSSIKELVTIMTRIGHFSKCFILADPTQTDLHNGRAGGFDKLKKLFSDEESKKNGVYTFEFTEEDVMRSELVKFIVKKLNGSI